MSQTPDRSGAGAAAPGNGTRVRIAVSWLLVGVPLAYGIFQTMSRAAALFG